MRTLRVLGRKPLTILGATTVALVAFSGSVSLAAGPVPITGCYGKSGALRIINKKRHQKCRKGEKPITWNATGPAGAAGNIGATGPQGVPGPATGTAGGSLTGNYPNPGIAAGAVGTTQLAGAAVTGPKLSIPVSLSWNAATTTQPMLALTSNTSGLIGNYASAAVVNAGINNTNGVGPAVYGSVNSQFGNAFTAGVAGDATGTGGYGVYATHSSSSGFGIAIQVQQNGLGRAADIETNNSSNSQPTLYVSPNGGPGLAAQFAGGVQITGNLSVTGAISAGTKDFKIDDPADPANKYLIHTAIESPQAENIYNGNSVTNAGGYAVVQLPSYFDAENTDPRYQLTVIGSFARAVVWREEHQNQFVIRTDQPRTRVSWQVTAIRNDPYSRSQRAPAQQLKPAADRGRYLYPQGYGKPASDAITATLRRTGRIR